MPARILDLLSEVAAELSAELPEGRVEIRVAGDDVDLSYVEDEHGPPPSTATGDLSARITLRLTEGLKARVEEGAAGEGVSVNTYIVRTLERGTSTNRSRTRRGGKPPARVRHDLKGALDMEKTFETPGAVRLYVENEVGLIAVTARQTRSTVVSLEADTPGAEELVERAAVECRPVPDGHVVAVKVSRRNGMRFVRRNAVTVRVEVPEGSDVKVLAGSADVEITGPVGERRRQHVERRHLHRRRGRRRDGQVGQRRRHAGQRWAVTCGCTPRRGTCAARAWPGRPCSPRRRATSRSVRRATGWR